MRIALALHVAGSECVVQPGILRALHRSFFVIHTVISQDFSPLRIGGGDLTSAMNDALSLIKVHGGGDVIGNN